MKRKVRNSKEHNRRRRHYHVRHVVKGTSSRPRVCVFRSNEHIYAQIIDDVAGKTLGSLSSLKIDVSKLGAPAADADEGAKKKKKKKKAVAVGTKILVAREVGRMVSEFAKDKGIAKIRFDRGGYLYHGRVAALADAMRENGLEF